MPLLQHVESGGEYLLPHAKKKLREWHDEMLRTGTRSIARAIYVSDGSLITINSVLLKHPGAAPADRAVFKDRIRITVAGGVSLRMWDPVYPDGTVDPDPGAYSAHTDTTGAWVESQAYDVPDWSKDYSTFAYWSGSAVVLKRDGTTTTLTNTLRLPDRDPSPFYKNQTAGMSANGQRIAALAASPTKDRIATVAVWNDGTSTFTVTDVPFPPAVGLDSSTVFTSQTTARGEHAPTTGGYDLPGSDDGFYRITDAFSEFIDVDTDTATVYANMNYRVLFDQFSGRKLYVDVRGWGELSQVASSTSGIPPQLITHTIFERPYIGQIWSYDLADATWAVEYESSQPSGKQQFLAEGSAFFFGGLGYTGGSGHVASFAYYKPVMTPSGLKVVEADPRIGADATTGDAQFTPNPGASSTYTYYPAPTYASTADIYVDGEAFVDDVALFATSTYGYRGMKPLHVSSGPLGAVVVRDTAPNPDVDYLYWQHTAGSAAYTTSSDDGTILATLFSRSSKWMYRSGRYTFYLGAQVADSFDFTPDRTIRQVSYERDGVILLTEAATVNVVDTTDEVLATEDGILIDGGFISLVDYGIALGVTVTYYGGNQGLHHVPNFDYGTGAKADWTYVEISTISGSAVTHAPTGTVISGGTPVTTPVATTIAKVGRYSAAGVFTELYVPSGELSIETRPFLFPGTRVIPKEFVVA